MKRTAYVVEYPGSATLKSRGWRRLASHVWQKAHPSVLLRATVEGLEMRIIAETK